MPDSFQKNIKYHEGDAVTHEDYGLGVIQEYDPEQKYIRVQFSNDNLVDLHASEIKQVNNPSIANIKGDSNNKSNKNNGIKQDLDESIIFTLKSIDSRRCKIDNIYKKVLLFCDLKIRGSNRQKYCSLIYKEILKLTKKNVVVKYTTQHGIWIKLDDCYENYLRKKHKEKEKNNQQLSFFEEKQFHNDNNQELLHKEEDNSGVIENEDDIGNFSIPDPDDLIESEQRIKVNTIGFNSSAQPSKLETMLGLNQSQSKNGKEDYDIDFKIDSIVTRLNSVKGIFASKEINTINIKLNNSEAVYTITGKIDRLNDSLEFISYLDYDESILSQVLSVSGGHHFSSIIGIQLKNGTQICMTIRKTIYNFTPTEISFKLLVNMIDDLRQVISVR